MPVVISFESVRSRETENGFAGEEDVCGCIAHQGA